MPPSGNWAFIVEAVAFVGYETVQVVPVVLDVEPDGSATVLNGIRDQLGDHKFEIRDPMMAHCVREAIANRSACDSARGRHGCKRQREFGLLQPGLTASEDLVHAPIDADEGVMGHKADRPLTVVRAALDHLGPNANALRGRRPTWP